MRILHNAKIITLNQSQPTAAAVVIDDHAPHAGRILAIGGNEMALKEFGGRANKEDMEGAVILPGLTDSHIHLLGYSEYLQKIDLNGLTKAECLEQVARAVQDAPPGEWILGHGWNQNNWDDGQFPTAADLDAVSPNHPVYLSATSMHAFWVNGAALKAAGVTSNTPNPKNGDIQRDRAGQLTGILLETASSVVTGAFPKKTIEEFAQLIKAAQESLWQMGLTGIHGFDRRTSFQALQTLHQRGELQLRVLKHLPVERLDEIISSGLRSGFGDDLLRIGGIKVFSDGALGSHTAAMLQPYEGEPDNKGMLLMDEEEFFEHASKAALSGLSMTAHAIGDSANHEMLKGYAQLRRFEEEQGLPRRRHRIEHAQILSPSDFAAFKDLDIIASVQPIHATSDMRMADKYWGGRAQYSYASRTLQESGARMTFGSDAPVDSPNPFWGIHAAVTRQRHDGSPGLEGWYPEQRLSLTEALHGYTHGPAYAAGMEDRLGMLAPDYLADLIVLDKDPFEIPPDMLRELAPTAVMVGGDWVWRA